MRALRTVVITVVCVLFAYVATEAADLYTPPVWVQTTDPITIIACEIVNVSNQPRTAQWELIDYLGNVVTTSSPIVIQPGAFGGAGSGGGAPGWFYCHFIVQGIDKNLWRAAIKLRSNGPPPGTDTFALPAE